MEARGDLALCADSPGTCQEPHAWVFMSPFEDWQDGFIVRVCTEQTGLLYLCRAAETGLLILTACAVHLSLLVPPLHSSSFLLPPEWSGFLFSGSGAYHSFLHCCPPHPPLREWKNILGVDFVCPVQMTVVIAVSLCLKRRGVCNIPTLFSGVWFSARASSIQLCASA